MTFNHPSELCPICNQADALRHMLRLPAITSILLDPRESPIQPIQRPADLFECRNCMHGWLSTENVVDYAHRDRVTKFGYEGNTQINAPIGIIKANIGVQRQVKTLEIGANDGSFLRQLVCSGVSHEVVAVEPNSSLAHLVEEKEIPCICDYFDFKLATEIKERFGKFDLIICRHVLEHVPYLVDFLKGCVDLLSDDGVIYFEFPNGDLIFKHGYFWEIWEEHLNYFSAHSAEVLFKRAGLEIHKMEYIPDRGSENICILCGASATESKGERARELIVKHLSRSLSVDLKALVRNVRKQICGKSLLIIGASHYQRNFIAHLGLGAHCQAWLDDDKDKVGLLPSVPGNTALVTGFDEYFLTHVDLNSMIVINGLFGHPNLREKLKKHAGHSVEILDLTALIT